MSVLLPPQIPLKAGLERVGLYFTPWAAAFALGAVVYFTQPGKPVAISPPTASTLPPQQWTTDAVPGFVAAALTGALPSPGPNQKRSGQCVAKLAQVELNGGCWVETKTPPPCPDGYQWEHAGTCWLPVAHAMPVPTSGDVPPATVAGSR